MGKKKDEFRLYLDERKALTEGESHSCTVYDKFVFPVAAAALGFSMTFIRDVVGTTTAKWNVVLVLAWFAFAIAVISTLFSLRFSASAFRRQCDIIEQAYRTDGTIKDAEGKNQWIPAVRAVNWVSCVAMFVGIAALVLFVAKNGWR